MDLGHAQPKRFSLAELGFISAPETKSQPPGQAEGFSKTVISSASFPVPRFPPTLMILTPMSSQAAEDMTSGYEA